MSSAISKSFSYLDQWESPFKKIIKARVDEIVATEMRIPQKDEL